MINRRDGSVRVDLLEKELSECLFEEKRHRHVDETKKAAISRVANYDEFKDFVACAQDMLKPVSSAELAQLRGGASSGWRKPTRTNAKKQRKVGQLAKGDAPRPKTPLDFERDWTRSRGRDERLGYLQAHGVDAFQKVWAVELNAAMLGDILDVILDMDESPRTVESWLRAVVDSPRFSLGLMFLDTSHQARIREKVPESMRHQFSVP